MEYYTYWSILDAPAYRIKSYHVALVIAMVAGLLWFLTKRFKKENAEGDRQVLLWALGGFFLVGVAMYFLTALVYPDNSDAIITRQLNSSCPKVEGVVSNFQREFRSTKWGNVITERFSVDSVPFDYSDAMLGRFGSFWKTENDVIFNGQRLKVTYRKDSTYPDNIIMKIEVAK